MSAAGLERLAESVATIPYAAPLSEKIERITAAICPELALPLLTVQGVRECERLLAFWRRNPEVHGILHAGPRVQKAQGLQGPVLVELAGGAISINVWRVPLSVEFFSDMCLDRAALGHYVTAVRALYDTLCFFKGRAQCAGEPAAAVSEQLRRDATRLHDRIKINIPSAIVPPGAVAAYMVRVRANCIAAHMLVLRNARNSFLQDDNQKAALLVRHMYHHTLDSLLCEKAPLLQGLPLYHIDAQRRRWGAYSSRPDFCDGVGYLLQHLVPCPECAVRACVCMRMHAYACSLVP